MKRIITMILIGMLMFSNSVLAHSGRTDANGGHYNRKTGQYHYHNPPGDSTTTPVVTPTEPIVEPPVVEEPIEEPIEEPKVEEPEIKPETVNKPLSPSVQKSTVPTSKTINVNIDGYYIVMDTPPIIEKGRTLVPLRAIFEALGAEVTYSSLTKTVIATKDDTTITLQIGKNVTEVNDKSHNLDVPAKIVQGRTLVPIRFVSEALGANVEWDGKTKTVYIISTGIPVSTSKPTPTSDETIVYTIDVGQADSHLIISGQSAMLIDGGNNADGDEVVKFIKDHGVKSLDVVIGTHPDEDHIGGLDDVILNIPVKKVITSQEDSTTKTYSDYVNAIKEKNIQVEYPANQKFTVGKANVEILGQLKDYKDVNDDSVVARVTVGKISFLFTGDMESIAENDLLNKLPQTTVLKVGHHGSATSTSQEFLNKVKPEVAVVSVGADNKYNHPSVTTINRIIQSGAKIYETRKNGTIYIWTDGNDYKVVVEKAA